MTKMTYVNAVNYAITSLTGKPVDQETAEQAIEKLVALGLSLEKRNASKSTKPTKKQVENGNVKAQILQILAETPDLKCGEIAEKIGVSGQKCSALLTQLVNTEQVVKWSDKRITKFALPDHDKVEALPGEITE